MKFDLARFEAKCAAAAELLKTLANEHRLMILCKLADREYPVGELVEEIGLSQSALSQHLAKLRADRLVATRRDAQTIYYRLDSVDAARVLRVLATIYCTPTRRPSGRPRRDAGRPASGSSPAGRSR